jgi:hypothetical protein
MGHALGLNLKRVAQQGHNRVKFHLFSACAQENYFLKYFIKFFI